MNFSLPYRSRSASFLVAAGASLLALSAHGQALPPDTTLTAGQIVARRALLERAQAAARAGDATLALSLAQQAGAIEMTVSLRMFLAQQYLALGRPTEAMEQSEYCVREASARQNLERREVITTECRRVSSVSQSQLVLATITVAPGAVATLSVRVGNRVVQPSEYNLPIAVDPVELEFVATAAGIDTYSERFRGRPGGSVTLVVPARFRGPVVGEITSPTPLAPPVGVANTTTSSLPRNPLATALTPAQNTLGAEGSSTQTRVAGSSGIAPTAVPSVVQSVAPSIVLPRDIGALSRIGAGPWVVMGAGGASFAASVIFLVLRDGQFGACRPVRSEILCDSENAAAQWRMATTGSAAYTYHTGLNATLIGGGVLLVGGLSWLIVNLASRPARTSAIGQVVLRSVSPGVSENGAWLTALGAF